MVMYSNEGGEWCLHTLVDPKRKRSQRRGSSRTFSSRSDRSRRRYSDAPEFLAHVQLDDAPRAPIQQSSGEREFRQHDGVVTILMFYRRRASPKHCNDIFELQYGGGGHRTRLRNDHEDQLVGLWGGRGRGIERRGGGEGRPSLWRALGIPTPTG